MLFNSLHFIIFLNIVLLIVCCIKKQKYQHIFLLIASWYFYWVSSQIIIVLLIIATLVSYYCGLAIYNSSNFKQRKIYLAIAIGQLLGALGYFKYINFGISSVNELFFVLFDINDPLIYLDVILPIGISFYTFQALSYVFDIYLNRLKPSASLKEYALFVAFFPQLVAGPIVRASEFLPQLKRKIVITPENLKSGVTLMSWGFFKKVAIADNIAPLVNTTLNNPIGASSIEIIFATFLFGIQIFCDFSGYTDIAIGAAKTMNFELPINFYRPYRSKSPTEFWHRWHISLSRFIRDYLYIPLGGNRKGTTRTYLNLMVTWLVCGLWHGAAWNFIAWGGYHGMLLIVHKIFSTKCKDLPFAGRVERCYPCILGQIILTQYFIFLGWLFFRVGDLNKLKYCIYKYVFFDFQLTSVQIFLILVICIFAVILAILFRCKRTSAFIEKAVRFDHIKYLNGVSLRNWSIYLIIIIIAIALLGPNAAPQFIYFQF